MEALFTDRQLRHCRFVSVQSDIFKFFAMTIIKRTSTRSNLGDTLRRDFFHNTPKQRFDNFVGPSNCDAICLTSPTESNNLRHAQFVKI